MRMEEDTVYREDEPMSKAMHMKVLAESGRAVRLWCLAALPHDVYQYNVVDVIRGPERTRPVRQ